MSQLRACNPVALASPSMKFFLCSEATHAGRVWLGEEGTKVLIDTMVRRKELADINAAK